MEDRGVRLGQELLLKVAPLLVDERLGARDEAVERRVDDLRAWSRSRMVMGDGWGEVDEMGARRRHSADHNYTKSTTTATRNHNHHTHNYNHTHYCTHLERLLHAPLPRHEPARRRQVPVGDRRRRAVLGLPQGGVDRLDDGVVVRQRVKVVVEDGLLGCCCCCVGLLLLLGGGEGGGVHA